MMNESLEKQAQTDAKQALAEDIGEKDLSASLLPNTPAKAYLYCRDINAVLCGQAWFEACFKALGQAHFNWHKNDGDELVDTNDIICEISSTAHALLSGERSALNFLQTLSATATAARQWQKMAAEATETTKCITVVDTRKTIPLLRYAQKYATRIGGIKNHRLGLFDEILIKENHISVAGSIKKSLKSAKNITTSDKIQIEVQTLKQLQEAIEAGATRVMLDNFSIDNIKKAVAVADGCSIELEASGNINSRDFFAIAQTGVHRVSIGAITKNIIATDFSLLFDGNH